MISIVRVFTPLPGQEYWKQIVDARSQRGVDWEGPVAVCLGRRSVLYLDPGSRCTGVNSRKVTELYMRDQCVCFPKNPQVLWLTVTLCWDSLIDPGVLD
jgi:hypothetical protein